MDSATLACPSLRGSLPGSPCPLLPDLAAELGPWRGLVTVGAVELAAIVLSPDVAVLGDHLGASGDPTAGGAAGQLAPAQELVDRGGEVLAAASVLCPLAVARSVDVVKDAGLGD